MYGRLSACHVEDMGLKANLGANSYAKLDILHVPSKVFLPYLTKCTRWIPYLLQHSLAHSTNARTPIERGTGCSKKERCEKKSHQIPKNEQKKSGI